MESPEIKDFTTTSFGLILAYLLPGVAALISLSLWRHSPEGVLRSAEAMLKEEGSAAAFVLLGLILAFLVGALLNGIRMPIDWLVSKVAKSLDMKSSYFSELNAEDLACILAVVDEYYRFYQFFGSIVLVALASVAALWWGGMFQWVEHRNWLAGCLVALAILAALAALLSKKYYVEIALEILGVEPATLKPWIKSIEHQPQPIVAARDLILTVKGKKFSSSSRIVWNGNEQATALVEGNLRTTIPAVQVTRGDAVVSVIEPEVSSLQARRTSNVVQVRVP